MRPEKITQDPWTRLAPKNDRCGFAASENFTALRPAGHPAMSRSGERRGGGVGGRRQRIRGQSMGASGDPRGTSDAPVARRTDPAVGVLWDFGFRELCTAALGPGGWPRGGEDCGWPLRGMAHRGMIGPVIVEIGRFGMLGHPQISKYHFDFASRIYYASMSLACERS
jgi:hypothetical protein